MSTHAPISSRPSRENEGSSHQTDKNGFEERSNLPGKSVASKPLPKQPSSTSPHHASAPHTSKRAKEERAKKETTIGLDLIDRLDISGLYGGGGLNRHDGPYAAASANRNKGPRAPMNAFDPATSSSKTSTAPMRPPRNLNLSARAQATLIAMEGGNGEGNGRGDYGKMGLAGEHARRNSDGSVTMGFPSSNSTGKGQQLVEMFGVRDSEAWEDFGTSRYTGMGSSRESIVPAGVSKEDRNDRAQSIWDIEATLKAGKPVGAVPPPMPALPNFSEPSGYNLDNAKAVKRSKSLVSRFRSVKRNPDSPMDSIEDDSSSHNANATSSHQVLNNHRTPPQQEIKLPNPGSAPPGVRFGQNRFDDATEEEDPRKLRFGGGTALSNTKSLGQESRGNYDLDSAPAPLGRRPSVMQRLFRGKAK